MSRIKASFAVDRGDFSLDVSLDLPAVGISALYGPSGSGKTTCLRAIAGLECLPGKVEVDGHIWQNENSFLPPHKRPIGYVFQEPSLFPHLDVEANMNFGRRRMAPEQRRISSEQVIELLGLSHLLKRSPSALSGGERQRVAIARALLTSPELLLMDEPLSALDKARKQEILPYLERMHQELELPIIYVSHAADEVTRLADHLVLLEQGQVKASGPLTDVLLNHELIGAFNDGASCVIDGYVSQHLEHFASTVQFGPFQLRLSQQSQAVGAQVRCRIFASDVSLCLTQPHDTSISNVFPAQIIRIDHAQRAGEKLVTLRLDDQYQLLAQVSSHSVERLQLHPHHHVWAQVKSVAVL